jgi:hypothetical protein
MVSFQKKVHGQSIEWSFPQKMLGIETGGHTKKLGKKKAAGQKAVRIPLWSGRASDFLGIAKSKHRYLLKVLSEKSMVGMGCISGYFVPQ